LKERRNEGSDCMDEMKALRYDVGIEGGYFVSNVNEVVKMKNVETLSVVTFTISIYGFNLWPLETVLENQKAYLYTAS
jgi:hypothetical protein